MLLTDPVEFEASFPDKLRPLAELWSDLEVFIKAEGNLPPRFELSKSVGWPEATNETGTIVVTSNEIAHFIVKNSLNGFYCHTPYTAPSLGFSVDFGQKSVRQTTLRSHFEAGSKAPAVWSPFLNLIFAKWIPICAFLGVRLYWEWQNAPFLDTHYESRYGKAPPAIRTQLEMSVDGIGPDRIKIDTSLNPGRSKELIPTVNFYPTAEMWLGPGFWQYAKCTKQEALAAGFWLETRDTPHYTYFKCWPTPFTRPDGEQGRMQQRLWKLFFHEDCEWPPGSGTICDEAMYGPPELMPKPIE